MLEIQDPKHIFRVTSLVQTHIPEAFLKENSGTELTYVIPERADKTSFKGLFQALDQSLHHLHVTGYGISDTTLEEVLLVFLCNGIFLVRESCSFQLLLLYLSYFTTVSCKKHVFLKSKNKTSGKMYSLQFRCTVNFSAYSTTTYFWFQESDVNTEELCNSLMFGFAFP